MENNRLNRSRQAKIKKEILFFLLSLIYSVSFSMVLQNILRLPLGFGTIVFISFVTLILLSIAFFNNVTSLASIGLLLLGGIALLIARTRDINILESQIPEFQEKLGNIALLWNEFLNEGYQFFYRDLSTSELEAYRIFAILLCLVIAIISFLFIQKAKLYWPLVFFIILLIPFSLTAGAAWALIWLAPMALVSFLMILYGSGDVEAVLRNKSGPKHLLSSASQLLVILVFAVILALVGSSTLKYSQLYSPYWQGILDDISTRLPDSLQADLTISPFSIGGDGLYPLTGRLGGTAEFNDHDIVEITGFAPSLLKVQSADHYDGLTWHRLVNNPNYRFASPFNGTAEVQVFNPLPNEEFFQHLPPGSDNGAYDRLDYSIRPLQRGSQLLFITGTPVEVESSRDEALLFYFNQAGTVYARSNFNTQHSYHVEALAPDPVILSLGHSARENAIALEQLDSAARNFLANNEPLLNAENAYENYQQLPDIPAYREGGSVYTLAQSLTENIQGDFQKARAILDYFIANPDFSYNLEVETPPENQDFVEHFLETKVGYCTYYATAMTMFLRLNGIPARYIEGYGLNPENLQDMARGDGFILHSENAHAWTEAYLNGIGWVQLDPTPGGVAGAFSDETPPEDPEPTTAPTTEDSTEPTTSTEETTESSTTVADESEHTTTMLPTTTEKETIEEATTIGKLLLRVLLALFVLAILAALAYLYIKKRKEHLDNIHNPAWLKEKYPEASERAEFYWNELLKLFRIENAYVPQAHQNEGDIITDFLRISEEKGGLQATIDWYHVGNVMKEVRYRKSEISEDKLSILAHAFDRKEESSKEILGDAAYFRKRILIP